MKLPQSIKLECRRCKGHGYYEMWRPNESRCYDCQTRGEYGFIIHNILKPRHSQFRLTLSNWSKNDTIHHWLVYSFELSPGSDPATREVTRLVITGTVNTVSTDPDHVSTVPYRWSTTDNHKIQEAWNRLIAQKPWKYHTGD